MTQKYDNDFKLHAVQLALEGHKPASEIAGDLGISVKSLYGWIAKYREDPETPFVGSGNLRPEAKAMRDLELESRQLREENEILKKPCASSPMARSSVCLDPQSPLRISGSEDVQSPRCNVKVDHVGAH
ncbi:transposase [Alicyclobacillus acidocaldarius]|uniref:transposase n=1 Tax=Alicyclobacillus acidocaldarius TaxID=405212 RepID=UPI00145D375A|nr:transposase [Alicyclobacillus acidocaldarius]